MTDKTTPDLTYDDRRHARDWAEHIVNCPETSLPLEAAAARAILHAVPVPTFADMTADERAECHQMQADVKGYENRAVILLPNASAGRALLLVRQGHVAYEDHASIIPRHDLPRLEWPGDTLAPTAPPVLPDGFRVADHAHLGRVIASPRPNDQGLFTIFARSEVSSAGVARAFATAEVLTFLDGTTPLRHHSGDTPAPAAPALPEGWLLANHPDYGRVVVTNASPDSLGRVSFVAPAPGTIGNDWHICRPAELTYLDTPEAVPPNTLTEGSVWSNADALARTCEESGRDQLVMKDSDGNVYVWGADAGWWEDSEPSLYAPFTILNDGKEADQ